MFIASVDVTSELQSFLCSKCATLVIDILSELEKKIPHSNLRAIVHGDLWASNIMIKRDSVHLYPPVFLDFQFASVGHVAEDIATLLCTSVDPSLRRSCCSEFVATYNTAVEQLWLDCSETTVPIAVEDYKLYLVKGLLLILYSFETWIEACSDDKELDRVGKQKALLSRFIMVVEDVMILTNEAIDARLTASI